MKYILSVLSIFSLLFLYSCGSDTTTNSGSNGNGETVIFSLDSLSIYLMSSLESKDTDIVINNAKDIKITFECITNADSINSFSLYRILAGDSNSVYLDTLNNYNSTINGNHTTVIFASNSFNLKLFIQIARNNTSLFFLKLRNIKIIKL